MMPRHWSLLAMAFFCADDIQPLRVAELVGIGEVHERQRRLLRRQIGAPPPSATFLQ